MFIWVADECLFQLSCNTHACIDDTFKCVLHSFPQCLIVIILGPASQCPNGTAYQKEKIG
ncbi:hypothetical protein HZS_6493 [Henneguya salminicola]|nr:hypothetical protein HZS_6493 [Henneguya salminicola]